MESDDVPPGVGYSCWSGSTSSEELASVRAVAADPRTPADVLEVLSTSVIADVRVDVTANPSTPPGVIRQMVSDSNPYVRAALAHRDGLAGELRERLVADPVATVRMPDGNSSPAELERLAFDPDLEVRCAVAEHPRCPPAALRELLLSDDWPVRSAAKKNPNAPVLTSDDIHRFGAEHPVEECGTARCGQPAVVCWAMDDTRWGWNFGVSCLDHADCEPGSEEWNMRYRLVGVWTGHGWLIDRRSYASTYWELVTRPDTRLVGLDEVELALRRLTAAAGTGNDSPAQQV